MREVEFDGSLQHLARIPGVLSEDEIADEPMIYGGSWDWTVENGGPITQRIMREIETFVKDEIPRHARMGYHPVVDTKTYLLMPGMYPSIPGWHCDGVIRKDRKSQPNLDTVGANVHHFVCTISTDTSLCPTFFLKDPVTIPVDEDRVWASVHEVVESRTLLMEEIPCGDIIRFSRASLHKCNPATIRGWRYFFRLSFYHMPALNEIRKQVQVYTTPGGGW